MRNEYNNITEVLNNVPNNFKILEETIDIEIQKEFFESTKDLEIDVNTIPTLIDQLNTEITPIEEKKTILHQLAYSDSVDAYRAIESYNLTPDAELKDWAILAFQQSNMIMHSSLLEEQQVFISTGLGGKDDKLRYFFIFPFKNNSEISNYQKESLKRELSFFLNNYQGELEELNLGHNRFATALALIPLKAAVTNMINEIVEECNQLGNFLNDDVIITNIKKFSNEEIIEIIAKHEE